MSAANQHSGGVLLGTGSAQQSSSGVINKHPFDQFSELPQPLQSFILALGAAPLNTCKAAAAVLEAPDLTATWLIATTPHPLETAAVAQKWDALLHLLNSSSSTQLLSRKDTLPAILGLASEHGRLDVVQRLIAEGAWAQVCESRHSQKFPLLLRSKAKPRRPGSRRTAYIYIFHPLICAAGGGRADVVALLLQQPGVPVPAFIGRQALCSAAEAGSIPIMQHLLNSVPGIREPGIGYNPLTAAAWGGHIPALQFLLQQGAHPSNQRGTPFSKSPTPCPVRAAAANNRSAKLMQFLLTNGICWCSWEALSRALEDAAAAGNVQVVQLLLDHLPDQVPEARFSSRGALYSAARKKHTAVMRALLEAGLDLPHSSINGALIASAEVGDVQGLALLKQHGADVNCMDREVCPPRTPILQAIRKNHAATVQWLLDNGATTEPSHQHEAIHSLATGALRRLIQHEHNVRMQQNKALFRAARRGFTDVLPMQLDAHLPPAPQEAAAVKARRCIVCSIQ